MTTLPTLPDLLSTRSGAPHGLRGLLLAAWAVAGAVSPALAQPASAATTCRADSGVRPPQVLELYTSEGCSSCPPADRWLSAVKGRADTLALAFHVNYWDRLGWPDRFASPEATQRQYERNRALGSAQVYTPQVMVDGRDWRGWPSLPAPAALATAVPALSLQRQAGQVVAEVSSKGNARYAGYWAVTEDRHTSHVRAGENAGETLKHDAVVRLFQPVSAWAAGAAPTRFTLAVSPGVPEHPRKVVFVVTDASTQKPVQALALSC